MPIGDLLAQISGEPSSPRPPTASLPPPKRKANEDLGRPLDKLQRTGPPTANSSRPVSQASRSSAVDSSMSKMKIATGSSRNPVLPSPTTTTFKNGQPTPPPTDASSKPAKKGSFAEIMARGKAAQASLGQVGKIQHKKIEKLPSKREREEMKAQKGQNIQKNIGPNGKFRAAGQAAINAGHNGAREGHKKSAPEPEKKIKKAATATTGYAGTARPKPGSARPASKSSSGQSRHDRGPDRYGSSSKRYNYASEDDEDEEEEEDYDSDASSDMEAAAYEVDDEEEQAARIARKEDAEALAEENKLKREKEEKRRRLAAMAKSRR